MRYQRRIISGICVITILLFSIQTTHGDQEFIFDETKTVQDNQIWHLNAEFVKEVDYTIDVEVTSGNAIDLLVMDPLNFGKYQQAFTTSTNVEFQILSEYSSLNVKSKTYKITLGEDTELYFVIENADFTGSGASGGGDSDVSIKVSYDTESVDTPGF